ncbi:hypothetical protein TNCV_3179451 [Trichonephila clavipes]|nr:hypothetical protein TNCV_3179451 [Trichonephila clavipes]
MPSYTRAFGDELRNFDHGEVTRTSPKLALFPLLTTTPTGGRLSSQEFEQASAPTRRVLSGTRLEFMTCQPRSDTLTTRLQWPRLFMEIIVFATATPFATTVSGPVQMDSSCVSS